MFVVGTAGHVDHGKSTLIRALSGIDPDRLKEEKERGLTIELGFAWVTLPSGREVSMVDVPGHERFVKNMLMGVGGIDLALFIVAADEGVMPQTREHLAILDLLDVKHAIIVLTKTDLVDPDWLELVTAEVEETLAGTALEGSPVATVSAERGDGLEALLVQIDNSLNDLPPRADLGRPRLPVDRAFTMSGFGAVVTGTLADGGLKVGQEIELLPSGRKARIRGLQSHQTPLDEARPGIRLAVNLSGIEHSDIERGEVLTTPGWLEPCTAFDASVRVIDAAPRPLRHNHRLVLYSGTSETPVTVRVLEGNTVPAGESGWAQVRATAPVPVVRGDRFVLRDTQDTIGGGVVLDTNAPRRRRNDPQVIGRLKALASGSAESAAIESLRGSEPVTAAALAQSLNMPDAEARELIDRLLKDGQAVEITSDAGAFLFSAPGWAGIQRVALDSVKTYHAQYAIRPGMPREELRNRLKLRAGPFAGAIERMTADEALASQGATVRLPSHDPALSPEQQRAVDGYLAILGSEPYSPRTDSPIDPELLVRLESEERIVRCGDVVYLASAFDDMSGRVGELARGDGGAITIASVREMFGTSRKYTLAFLEELDRRGVTVRRGDDRTLLNP